MIATTQSDSQLFQELTGERNRAAFNQLFCRWYTRLLSFASQYVEHNDAENAVQDVMTYLWENAGNIHIQTSISTYFFSAVKYRCLTLISRGQVKQKAMDSIRLSYIDDAVASSASHEMLYRELRILFRKTLDSVPDVQKEAFILSRHDGLTYEKIAQLQQVSEKTVEYRISQVLKRLRDSLSEYI